MPSSQLNVHSTLLVASRSLYRLFPLLGTPLPPCLPSDLEGLIRLSPGPSFPYPGSVGSLSKLTLAIFPLVLECQAAYYPPSTVLGHEGSLVSAAKQKEEGGKRGREGGKDCEPAGPRRKIRDRQRVMIHPDSGVRESWVQVRF